MPYDEKYRLRFFSLYITRTDIHCRAVYKFANAHYVLRGKNQKAVKTNHNDFADRVCSLDEIYRGPNLQRELTGAAKFANFRVRSR